MIKIKNLKKEYVNKDGKFSNIVLENLNLSLNAGKSLAIMGESGSGKSTLLKIMGALDVDYEGEVLLFDKSLKNQNQKILAEFRKNNIGFIFQNHYFLPQYNLIENVLIPTLGSPKSAFNKAQDLLAKVGLSEKLKSYPFELSGGELQRASLARALINSPKILLADEPTGALDSKNSDLVIDIINSIENLTKVVVTHSHHIASKMENISILEDGILK